MFRSLLDWFTNEDLDRLVMSRRLHYDDARYIKATRDSIQGLMILGCIIAVLAVATALRF